MQNAPGLVESKKQTGQVSAPSERRVSDAEETKMDKKTSPLPAINNVNPFKAVERTDPDLYSKPVTRSMT
jgi:hypothetical protein